MLPFSNRLRTAPWNDGAPVRAELFGVERLEQHAGSLAVAQTVTAQPSAVLSLHTRLSDNATTLLDAYRLSAAELDAGRSVEPAAEWLLDNYHLVEDQIREIRNDLPPQFYRQLPKLANGPLSGYPRVFGLAWAYVAHTDSHFVPEILRRFIAAYQEIQPLSIGELWAVAITLRIVLIENLRRLADQITAGILARRDADALADRLLVSGMARAALDQEIEKRSSGSLPDLFVAQLAKRLRDQDPRTTPGLEWLEDWNGVQGSSLDDAVLRSQQRQGASNVSVRNVITSMRLISDIDWAEFFESVSLVDSSLRKFQSFQAMDFPTRNMYRSAIEQLSRGSAFSEIEIADRALDASKQASNGIDIAGSERARDPGFFLIAEGRVAFERELDFHPPFRLRVSRFYTRLGIGGYVGAILLVAAALLGAALWVLDVPAVAPSTLALLAFAGAALASDVATALVNRAITWSFGPMILPGLELADGVPASLRTLIAVPTLLTSEIDLREQVERLEVHYLAGTSGDLTFALLSDGIDADQVELDSDKHLLDLAVAGIGQLNRRYGPGPAGPRFLLLHRRRVWNERENKWMGWERKRGKLHELNRLLRGANDTTFVAVAGVTPHVPADVRFVITLDADTRLPRDVAIRLIGKMAHPLNRPKFNEAEQRVASGYAILQPRVTPSLPIGREGSVFQRVFSGPGGIDPYAAAVSDVYQDLFGEGSYTGKGIYDVDAFEKALAGRVPENMLLSHDLFEGIFARAGLASDVELVEEFPARYDVASTRQHRWARGDWQLLPWIMGKRTGNRAVPAIGRGKMLDNLRRSLIAPSALAALCLSLTFPVAEAAKGVLLVLAAMTIPAFLPVLLSVVPSRPDLRLRTHLRTVGDDLYAAGLQMALSLALLPDQAWRMGDAILRTLLRLIVTRRNLLEWTTAAQAIRRPRLTLQGFYREMAVGTSVAFAVTAGALLISPASWPVAVPLALLWLAGPALALWSSRSPSVTQQFLMSGPQSDALRLIARRTWRYFETFVTPVDNMLPPDNFQEDPNAVIAHRTSPTNMGLYLLSAIAARDFGWAGTVETIERLEATSGSMLKLQRFKGHFYNWYGTRDLRALDPPYISSVDSGNLAGHLIVVANACELWADTAIGPDLRRGLIDTLRMLHAALMEAAVADTPRGLQLAGIVDEIDALLDDPQDIDVLLPRLGRLADLAVKAAREIGPKKEIDPAGDAATQPDLLFWADALRRSLAERDRDRLQLADAPYVVKHRLHALADMAREMALAMDFKFLLDPARKLLSIGYSVPDNRLDPSCYDLLASEARLASLFAIAKGDAPTRHWFRLGRPTTPLENGAALISWSGSMFEYLMPSLVMRAPAGSLLEQTNRLVVARQQSYARALRVPWGISEAAYNARDLEFTYQYSNFGVPGLGLKRGLSENTVIAPYATGLATMVDPRGSQQNYARLAAMGALGRYGFYEALDFTRSRLPDDESFAIVRNFMAHHQGMTLVALANALQDGLMRTRFHREPMIQATDLLLQERMPREISPGAPPVEEKAAAIGAGSDVHTVRRLDARSASPAPMTHLLSNGRYAVMLTSAGAGYSRWRDIAVTRWQEDTTRDHWGSFVFLRDRQGGKFWSATAQPVGGEAERQDVVFGEDHAVYTRCDGSLTTVLEVLVSSENDGEVRRVTLANSGRRPREIDVTSYLELVLATPGTDNAHPAFAKMFVQTEHLPELGALIATRRPRSPGEPSVWAAHFAVVDGNVAGETQHETDRARFIGRDRTIGTAVGIVEDRPLSNTVGTVLDPIFALRQPVLIPPGGVARIAFWTLAAESKAELLDLIDKHHESNAFDRAKTLAWTQAQVQLRHLDMQTEEAADFQRLAAPILYADRRFRSAPEAILRGAGPQSGLWPHGISGDLPIVLLRIDDIEDIAQVRQLLRAHEYWRIKRLAVDLVIINERASSYIQDLQIAIETAVRSSQSRPRLGAELAQGSVYALRADLMSAETRALLGSVARVTLSARRGPIAGQVSRRLEQTAETSAISALRNRRDGASRPPISGQSTLEAAALTGTLEFFNGLGGFDRDGREYVTVLEGGRSTPAPWINVVANPAFGFQVSAAGSSYSWAENSRENQLTPWSNDPVQDPAGEAIYVRDEVSGILWSPTAQPVRDEGTYLARHGHGYSRFEHRAHGISLDLLQYVPIADPIKISRLTLLNLSGTARRLSVTAYAEWVLGTARSAAAPFITTERDDTTGALFARNPWGSAFPGRVAFADLGGAQTAWTADRTEFLGRQSSVAAPAALLRSDALAGTAGAGLDPCAALQQIVEIAPNASAEIVFFLGQVASADEARTLIQRYRATDLDTVLEEVTEHWDGVLGTVQVKTPDRAMDIMLNGWLLYQTLACRIWARSAFYQASGAYGFRDQLQDGMALTAARPEETRRHILRAAGRQFVEGDVQHWWLPHSGQGVRTRISDDRVWLSFATATYVACSGDTAVLDEVVPFLEGQALHEGEHDAFFQPGIADESASLFEHCARGLDQCLTLTGAHGLPLMGTGDWNDGMNRVGEGGKGESVWLAWLLLRTITLFAPLAESRDPERAKRWRNHAESVKEALDRDAWDGEWYRRATFDDGTWLGSHESDECRIDSIAQSWSVLSGAGNHDRAAQAMSALEKQLIRRKAGMALLFTPPFDKTPHDPGYIKGYPPGLRENGGQYSHAAMWVIFALAALRQGDKAAELFALLNPINHALTSADVECYKVEPYVVAADVYSVPPHTGRGGWTWYTGSAGWMYRAGIEAILGIRREGASLVIDPRLPAAWAGFEATVRMAGTCYDITISRGSRGSVREARIRLDGKPTEQEKLPVRVPLDQGVHALQVSIGAADDRK